MRRIGLGACQDDEAGEIGYNPVPDHGECMDCKIMQPQEKEVVPFERSRLGS